MPPIVSFVGKSTVGKTTLLERLLSELKGRGYRLAAIKHVERDFELDQQGKDSWRLARAGSDMVAISSPQKVAFIRSVERDSTLEELSRFIGGDVDLVLTEGFKKGNAPKIEIHRRELGELLCPPHQLLAIVSDEPLDLAVPQYSPDDTKGLADLIEQRFLLLRKEESLELFVNGARVPLNPFVEGLFARTLTGMVSALDGIGKIEGLDIQMRRKSQP